MLQTIRKHKGGSATARKSDGFTIIEVLIVLAIAGLIMVIVFLAVPSLQRSQRNNARKNDAARIGTAADDFVSNNNGTPPIAKNAQEILNDAGKMGEYDLSGTTSTGTSAVTAKQLAIASYSSSTTITSPTDNEIIIYTGAQCDTTQGGYVASGSSRQMAMLYTIEISNGWQAICQNI